MIDRIIHQERHKSFDRQNHILLIGMGVLKQKLRITANDLRNAVFLRSINDTNRRIGLIERMELEITSRMYNGEGTSNDENSRRRSSRLSRDQPQRINSRSRSRLRSQLSERSPAILIGSDSETESEPETESDPVSAGCPKSVRDRMRCLLEPQIRDQVRREIEPQLRDQIQRELELRLRGQIQREMELQLRTQISRELEPQLRDRIRREITPQLGAQIYRELEPQLREQIRREILPTRYTVENEIREADERNAWVDFLLYIINDYEVDLTLETAIAICEVCISPCMNRRPIALNCGHIFCGTCVRDWAMENRVCPKCRTQISFSRSVFRTFPTLEAE